MPADGFKLLVCYARIRMARIAREYTKVPWIIYCYAKCRIPHQSHTSQAVWITLPCHTDGIATDPLLPLCPGGNRYCLHEDDAPHLPPYLRQPSSVNRLAAQYCGAIPGQSFVGATAVTIYPTQRPNGMARSSTSILIIEM